MSEWAAIIAGRAPQQFSELGIVSAQRARRSQGIDAWVATIARDSILNDLGIAVGDVVDILRDGAPWFTGRVTSVDLDVSGGNEGATLRVSGPWWYLDQLVYQQVWHIYGGGDVTKSHCLLNTWADGLAMGIRDQLHEALAWTSAQAAARYGAAPFAWDKSGFPNAQIPPDEVRDITSGEVIRKQLRWVPDAVTWFDYSTTPPTFHCSQRSALSRKTISTASGIQSLRVVPRSDLVVPAVVLKFERTDQVDGVAVPSVSVDAAPSGATGTEFGALCATIDLQGFSVSYARAAIESVALPPTSNSAAWWQWMLTKERWLQDTRVQLLEVRSVTRIPSEDPGAPLLDRELVAGQIPDWLDVSAQQETVTIEARVQIVEGADADEIVLRRFTASINTTSAATGEYTQAQSVQAGEVPPVGLAQFLYDALSVLEYEGNVSLGAIELPAEGSTDAIGIGDRLSISGLRSEWADMAAMVQEVSEDITTGQRSIRFGPPQHLGPRDLVELLRVNRFRQVFTASSKRAGQSTSTDGVGLGRTTRLENSGGGAMNRARLVIRGETGGGRIVLDAGSTIGKELAVREVAVCVNGAEKRMLLIASAPYDA